ncbi:MAG: glycoside hydrolase domain-containing protein, partial [Promethearchaeota archaeon]
SSNHIANKIIQFIFGIVIFAAVLFILAILGLSLYIFEFTLYLPQVLGYTFVWAVVGVIVFIAIEKIKLKPRLRQTLSNTMVIIALLLIITNFWNLTLDLIENNAQSKSGAFDIYFPFEFLFSNKNIILVGISMGYLLSILMKTLMKGLKNTNMAQYRNSTSILFFFLAPVAIGCLIGFSSMIIDLPGGNPTLAIMESENILPMIGFGIALLVAILLLKFNVSAAQKDKDTPARSEEVSSSTIKEILKTVSHSSNSNGGNTRTKAKATAIISVVIISVLSGGLGALIGVTASRARSMPVLVSTSGYDIWMANSSERFNHQTKISVSTSPLIEEVTFNMAKNEYYAFQLGITLKSRNAYFHSYYLTDFIGVENSSELISSESAQLRYEDYILEEEFPDKLLPIEGNPILLNNRQTHMFWFDIRTPYNLTSGHFTGTLTITFKLGDEYFEEKIPIRFFVWDYAIPLQKHVTTNVGDASVPDYIYDELVENWLDHRFNSYAEDIRGTDNYETFEAYNGERVIYYLNKTDNSVTFNWTLWDHKIEALLNVTNAPMNGIRVDYSLGRSLKIRNETENKWFLNWLIEVEQHLDMKGWLNICYYYFVDEFSLFIPDEYTRAEYYLAVEAQLASMKAAAPKMRIMVVAPPLPDLESIKPYIDIYVPLSYDRDVYDWEKTLGQGKEIWHYTCVGPFAPYPNVHLYNRLYETRLQMWNSWAWNIHGYLFWRANSFNHGQYGLGYNSWGDGWLIYIDEVAGRIYDSIRWENLGESQEDYEMFWLLNATLNKLESQSLLSPSEIEAYRTELDAIVDKVTDDFLDYTNDPHDIYNGYNRIGQILHALSSLTDIKEIGETPWYPVSGVSP